mgnify:CR=1 FL=1
MTASPPDYDLKADDGIGHTFWVVSDVDIASIMQGSANEIGNVGGKTITYQEFQNVVEQAAEVVKQGQLNVASAQRLV